MKEKNATQKIVIAALLAALTCVATMIIKIPSPLKGYLNLGDWRSAFMTEQNLSVKRNNDNE